MNRDEVLALLRANPSKFYVYGLVDPRDGRLFYVGEGKGYRVLHHTDISRVNNDKNWRKKRAMLSLLDAGLMPSYVVYGFFDTKQDGLNFEAGLIAVHKYEDDGGTLVNRTSRGNAVLYCSPELRAGRSERAKSMNNAPGARERRRLAIKKHIGKMISGHTPESREKQRESVKQRYNQNPELRAKAAARSKQQFANPDARAKTSEAIRAAYAKLPEKRAGLAAKKRVMWANMTPEVKAARAAKKKAAMAARTPEQNAASVAKWRAARAPELIAAAEAKRLAAWKSRTPEQHAAATAKRLAAIARNKALHEAAQSTAIALRDSATAALAEVEVLPAIASWVPVVPAHC